MPRPSILFLAIGLFSANLYGADPPKQSPAVKRVLDKAVADVKKNRQEFDKANQKPLGEARKELEEISTKLIKDGKAEEAGVVLKQVGTLEADVLKMANAPAPVGGGGGRVQPQKPLLEMLVGRWQSRKKIEIEIQPNGTLRQSDGNHGRLVLIQPDVAEMTWQNGGSKWQIRMVNESMVAVAEFDPSGDRSADYGTVLERIK